MKFSERKLKGLYEVTPHPHMDSRGFFMRTFDAGLFKDAGLHRDWVQENHSRSERLHIIRGLHFQLPPHAETKLIRCIEGAVLDVVVDLRTDSETYGQWDSIVLSAENKKMFFIPRGFAHGFCTLSEVSEVVYKVDNFYTPAAERGLMWNDTDLKIDWPVSEAFVSEKDQENLSWKDFSKTNSISLKTL